MQKKVHGLILLVIFFLTSAIAVTSISLKELISSYNFDFNSSEINATQLTDMMIDTDDDSLNDTFIVELNTTNINKSYIAILELFDNGIIITNETNISTARFNISLPTLSFSKEKFNYSIKIYNTTYNLKFRKTSIETKSYSQYKKGFAIINITDKKLNQNLIINVTLNSTINGTFEIEVFLSYNNSIILEKENKTISNGIQTFTISFDNETIKKTHYTGNFNISTIKIGQYILKQNKLTDYYIFEDFAVSYISSITDEKSNGNLKINLNLSIQENDNYNFEAEIYDLFGALIDTKNESYSFGKQKLSIGFNGTRIYSKKLNGPFEIRNIKLFQNNKLVDFIGLYQTNYYNFDEFSKPILPDLNISIIATEEHNYGINNVSINITITNIGKKTGFNLFLDISDNNTLSDTYQISTMDAEGKKIYTYNFKNFGDFEITAIADINNLIEEINESNNALTKLIRINKKPSLNEIKNFTINETDKLIVNLSAMDNNSDALSYKINSTRFAYNSNIFEWQTNTLDSGNYTFFALVSDTYLNDSKIFYVRVIDMPEKDSDNDGINESVDTVIGDKINASIPNVTIVIGNSTNLSKVFQGTQKVEIKDYNATIIEFDFNFSNKLNLANITVNKQNNDSIGFLLVKGLRLAEGKTKALYIDRINAGMNGICIKDTDVLSISEISSECNNLSEFKVECDGTLQNGYACIFNSTLNKYKVTGLQHSGIAQISYSKPLEEQGISTTSSGGGGGGGKLILKTFCIPEWSCSEWSACSDKSQKRICRDNKNCNASLDMPSETRECNASFQKDIKSMIISESSDNKKKAKISDNKDSKGRAKITGSAIADIKLNKNQDIISILVIILGSVALFAFYFRIFKPEILILFIFIILNVQLINALWPTYQNDLANTGKAVGIGYFPLTTTNFSANFGMNFQPLVGDIDNNGKNEIVIFYDNSMIIADKFLAQLNKEVVGTLLGEAVLFDYDNDSLKEIIFNSRQKNNPEDYFFVFNYNGSSLIQEFNISISNKLNGSGIKCLTMNSTNYCIFIDNKNFVHIVDMNSKAENSFATTTASENISRIPAIADIDSDGNYEVVFWLDNNTDGTYGFLVFDLNQNKVEKIVDNIYSAGLKAILKGQPVLADINKDNKSEIAMSVFYDDIGGADTQTDWFTEIFVYSYNGTKLFSKCSVGFSICNDGSSRRSMLEGTNPFVLDFDSNGIDDICFIKDYKKDQHFQFMALNCYNYSGIELSNVNITLSDTVKGALTADMNNDGLREVITEYGIYHLNGSLLYIHELNNVPPIAVDVDGNNGLDLLWSYGNKTRIFLDNTSYSKDIAVYEKDIYFFRHNNSHINVSSIIRNTGQVELSNVKTIIYNVETLENKSASLNIRASSNSTFSSLLALRKGESVLVRVDFDNEINESDETNNFAFREFFGLPYVFVSVTLEPSIPESVFLDFIKSKLVSGYYTDKENEANMKVYIGKNNLVNKINNFKTLGFGFGYGFGDMSYYDKSGVLPYNGLIGGFKDSGIVNVMIVGNEIEGTIAGVKEFVNNQDKFIFLEEPHALFLDDENLEAIKVYDYLHNSANLQNYMKNNDAFRNIVKNALYDEMFTMIDKTVTSSNGIVLRLRNLRANFSDGFISYLNSTGVPVEVPVVLGHGLWGNLSSYETLGGELANIGRDVWLIEITGGTGQDCDSCIDYSFDNLTDSFVPALLGGVLNFTNKERLQYVGHSNGCRAVLSSLEKKKFEPNKVETFVAVGCPGAFEGFDVGSSLIRMADSNKSIESLERTGKLHIGKLEAISSLLIDPRILNPSSNPKISLNLLKQYVNWIDSDSDLQPGRNLSLDNFAIIQGTMFITGDGIVTTKDEKAIYDNIKLNQPIINKTNRKYYFSIVGSHFPILVLDSMENTERVKLLIKKSTNKQKLTFYQQNFELKEYESIEG